MACCNVESKVARPVASWSKNLVLVLWLAWSNMSSSAFSEAHCAHWLRNSTRRLAMGDRSMIGSETETACLRILSEAEVGEESHEVGAAHEGGEGGEGGESGEGEEGEEGGESLEEEKEELEHEAEEEIEEAEYTDTDREVACMLLGSVSFVLALLYLVNWDDDDIRRYTWKIISTTISIFLAVLLFGGFNQLVLKFFGDNEEEIEHLPESTRWILSIVQVLHCLVYVVALQLAIAIISGAMFETDRVDLDELLWVVNDPLTKDHDTVVPQDSLAKIRNPHGYKSNMHDKFGIEVPVQKMKVEYTKRDRWMKCYARLLAHMAGFAAINAGATMQQLKVFHHWALLLLPILIVQAIIMCSFKIFQGLRAVAKKQAKEMGRSGRRAHMMEEEVSEAENDISCLSISFLIIQVIRFSLTGILPNAEGIEPAEKDHLHSKGNIAALYGIAGFFAFLACIMVVVKSKMAAKSAEEHHGHGHHEEGEHEEEEGFCARLAGIGISATSMCFAWGVLWATRWWCLTVPMFELPSIMGRVVMALMLSTVSCLAVFCLDFVDDAHKGSEDSKAGAQAIQMMVNSLGILIGFSWEHTFDGGVNAVANATRYPETVKFVMGVVIAALMVPMWRRHILTKEVSLQQRKEEYEEMQARVARQGNTGHE